MNNAPTPEELPANIKFLRILVTILTSTMILGLLVVIALLVIRIGGDGGNALPLPETITLPDGATATAFTQGGDWYAVVTAADEILIFDRETGELRQIMQIEN